MPSSSQRMASSSRGNLNSASSHSNMSSGESQPPLTQKEKNEDYFRTLGSANSTRSEALPPSQGMIFFKQRG